MQEQVHRCCEKEIDDLEVRDYRMNKEKTFLYFTCSVCRTDYRIPVYVIYRLDRRSIKIHKTTENIAQPNKVKVGDVLVVKNQYKKFIGSDTVRVTKVIKSGNQDSKKYPFFDIEKRWLSDPEHLGIDTARVSHKYFALNLNRHKDQFPMG
tara:strand:- start:19693 stop:20145 length:453 start_codon:yes stop_codon:yes gene_type:complete